MKKIITLCVALIATIVVSAQQPMAILDHNDTITVYYGNQALENAYNAAVAGDIITLSEGNFNGNFNMTKNNITVRGAGVYYDSITGQNYTIISNSESYYFYADSCTFEGLRISCLSIPYYRYLSNNRFVKCRIGTINTWTNNNESGYKIAAPGATFVMCRVGSLEMYYFYQYATWSNYYERGLKNTRWENCIIENISCSSSGNNLNDVINWNNQFYHCVIGITSTNAEKVGAYYNCILWATDGYTNYDHLNPLSYSCIGLARNGDVNYSFWSNNSRNLVNRWFSNTFTDFDGTNINNTTYTLTPEAQAVLGSDSTQIGIYGGVHPYNPRVDVVPPIIGRVTVPNHSNAEGRLDVNVEIINAQ